MPKRKTKVDLEFESIMVVIRGGKGGGEEGSRGGSVSTKSQRARIRSSGVLLLSGVTVDDQSVLYISKI